MPQLRCPLRDYITDTVVDPVENQLCATPRFPAVVGRIGPRVMEPRARSLLTTSMDGSVIVHDLLAPRSRLDGLIHEVASVQGCVGLRRFAGAVPRRGR